MKPRIDIDINSGIRSVCKLIKFMIKTNNKLYKPKTYNKAIYDLIHRNKQCKAINKEL